MISFPAQQYSASMGEKVSTPVHSIMLLLLLRVVAIIIEHTRKNIKADANPDA